MQLEKDKKYRIEELKLFPEWELYRDDPDGEEIGIKPVEEAYTEEGIIVTQKILDSWTIEEIRPKLKTGYYTTEELQDSRVFRVLVEDSGEVLMWVALELPTTSPHSTLSVGAKLSDIRTKCFIEEGLIPCKISVELLE